jgi:hypothetical protein
VKNNAGVYICSFRCRVRIHAQRKAFHTTSRIASPCSANCFARRSNCGKHALESSNRDHIDAPLLRELQALSCVTAYRKQTRAALKRGN